MSPRIISERSSFLSIISPSLQVSPRNYGENCRILKTWNSLEFFDIQHIKGGAEKRKAMMPASRDVLTGYVSEVLDNYRRDLSAGDFCFAAFNHQVHDIARLKLRGAIAKAESLRFRVVFKERDSVVIQKFKNFPSHLAFP